MHTGTPHSSFPVLPQNSAVQTTRPSKAPLAAPDEWQQISPQKKVPDDPVSNHNQHTAESAAETGNREIKEEYIPT